MAPGYFRTIVCLFASYCVVADCSARQSEGTSAENSKVVGDWRGQSSCVVRESACHDEDSLYHVTKSAEKAGWFTMTLDKIVDGKPVTMGSTDCSYEAAKASLTCKFARGILRFTVQDNAMTGTMTLTDGTLWRKLSLKKTSGT